MHFTGQILARFGLSESLGFIIGEFNDPWHLVLLAGIHAVFFTGRIVWITGTKVTRQPVPVIQTILPVKKTAWIPASKTRCHGSLNSPMMNPRLSLRPNRARIWPVKCMAL